MVGVSDTRFAPNGAMTRGQLMTVLYRMAGEPETKGQSPFADVEGRPVLHRAHCLGF